MKNLLFIAATMLIVSCNTPNKESASTDSTSDEAAQVDRSIGFNTMLPELNWHLGTEEAVQVVKDLDEKWAAEDYDAMRGFFADTAVCYFSDGRVAKSADEFIVMLKAEDEGSEISWSFDYAYSVDLDPTRGGEHVQAGFTGTSVKAGVETKKRYHESYYVIEGKIVLWNQYTTDILEE